MRFFIRTSDLNAFNHYAHSDCADNERNGYGDLARASGQHVSYLASIWGFKRDSDYDSRTDRYIFTVHDPDTVDRVGIGSYGTFEQ